MVKKNKGRGSDKADKVQKEPSSDVSSHQSSFGSVLGPASVLVLLVAAAFATLRNHGPDSDSMARPRVLPQTLCDCPSSKSVADLCHTINASDPIGNTIPLDEIYRPLGAPKNGTNVGILMMYSDEIANYTTHTATMNAAYANSHSYDLMLVRAKLEKDPEHKYSHAVTALPQSKIKIIRDALVTLPEGGWLLWLDSDLAILRHDVTVEGLLEEHGAGPLTDLLVSLEMDGNSDADEEDASSASFSPRGVNTGALLLRHSPWTLKMLEAWHSVGYDQLWGLDELSEWGQGFLEHTKKLPPDQQMHTELQRPPPVGLGDDYFSHALLLPTTALNHRWPAWALDGFDDNDDETETDSDSKSGKKQQHKKKNGGDGGGLQFAFHQFASTSKERVRVLSSLHRAMLCPRANAPLSRKEARIAAQKKKSQKAAMEPSFESPQEVAARWASTTPRQLSQVVASEMLAALGQRAMGTSRNSMEVGELCNALYTWAGGTGVDDGIKSSLSSSSQEGGGEDYYHAVFTRVSEKHRECLDPGLASEVARHMMDRRNYDSAAFALQVATSTAERIIYSFEHEDPEEHSRLLTDAQKEALAAPGTVVMEAGMRVRGDPATIASFIDHLKELVGPWNEQLEEAERLRAESKSFFSSHTPPGHENAKVKLPKPPRRRSGAAVM